MSPRADRQPVEDVVALSAQADTHSRVPARGAENSADPRAAGGRTDAVEHRREPPSQPESGFGFPATTLLAGVMLAVVAGGHALSRSGQPHGEILFWIGVAAPTYAVAVRQASPGVARSERISLLLLLGIFFYFVKVLRDPFMFTFADEFVAEYNTRQVVETGQLFSANPLLPATPDYPGIVSAAAAIASLTGLSVYAAGLVVAGAARIMMVLAVYLLLERITETPRVAALGVVAYCGAANFLYYTAEFSYESLALPLAVAAGYAVVSWMKEDKRSRGAWAVAAVALTAAVVVTHHVTSYALVAFLGALSVAHGVTRGPRGSSPLRFAAAALALTAVWLFFVADGTASYLEPVFGNAIESTVDVLKAEGSGAREAFKSKEGVPVPIWDRGASLTGALLTLLLVPFGLLVVWRRHRRNAAALVLAGAAIMYVATFPLRLVTSAWEIANRSSEFLFIGVGGVIALAWVAALRRAETQVRRVTVALLATVVFVGGAALGWKPEIRLSQSLRVAVDDTTIEPQGLSAARWTRRYLPGDERNTYAANGANSRLLMNHGRQPIRTGGVGGADLAIELPLLEPWQVDLLRDKRIRYVLMDRRYFTDNHLSGYYFPTQISPRAWDQVVPSQIFTKFDRPATSRLYDSGDVALYDIRRLVESRGVDG